MAKKKSTGEQVSLSKAKADIKLLEKDNKELRFNRESAKELIDDKDKEIATLTQQIKNDKGITSPENDEIVQLKKKARKLGEINTVLGGQIEELKTELTKSKSFEGTPRTVSVTEAPPELVALCLGDFNSHIGEKKFLLQLPMVVANAITLANEIHKRCSGTTCRVETSEPTV